MRTRLLIVFLTPLTGILLVLGTAYAWSLAQSVQQGLSSQQSGDINYFVSGARQSLRTDDPGVIAREVVRYSQLYGARVVMVDHRGDIWVAGGLVPAKLSESDREQLARALSGRRVEVSEPVLPWSFGEATAVEPVLDDGRVIGAVLIAASLDSARGEITRNWGWLLFFSFVVTALLFFAIFRLANWVLKPMNRVDAALTAIEHGDMEARIANDTGPPEMRRMIRLFNSMAEEIERVMQRQQEFVMNASHELRNPLGALLLRVETLATGLDDSWDEDVEKTREEGRRMTRILDTLLGVARRGQHDSSFVAVDLTELVARRVVAWRGVASEHGATFELVGHRAVLAVTDRTAVESALDAIIDNALKFTPSGSVIEVVTRTEDEWGVISIRDHGPGLAPEELDRVTGRFWRSPRDQNVPGSGLGLAIATDLLTSLRGTVQLSLPPGGGLEVRLCVPLGGNS